jgi:hypothetical protein
MGILDEAIREHLDLKRRQGAADDELKRLEDEAFGPPTRPGDPDFPDRESEEEAEGNGSGTGDGEIATSEARLEEGAPPIEEPAPPAGEAEDTEPVGPTVPEEPPPVEPPPVEEPPAEEPPPVEARADPATEDQSAFYDQSQESGLELGDLDLELDEEVAEPAAPAPPPPEPDEPPIESLDTVEHEPPIESLDTVEHPAPVESLDTVEHQIEELEEGPVEETPETPETPEPAEPAEEPEGSAGAREEDSEDVLEETPEFLRDAPEDDELWFEQGEPKDFDF